MAVYAADFAASGELSASRFVLAGLGGRRPPIAAGV
jgi:hypothetical protein